ncbi:DUF4397 domain-containing protein [Bacillus sp. A301a_S52]|nr:DUF4397 domain-containing protein [Bacillus sp. A301a_S52]
MKTRWLISLSFLVMLLGFASIFPAIAGAEKAEEAKLRIVHASPNTSAVDVYVNKDKIISDMGFKDVSEYLAVEEGSYDIKLYSSGSKPDDSEPVLEENVTVMGGEGYTFAAGGKSSEISLFEFKDELSSSENEAKIRVIHLSPDAPAIDVYSLESPLVKALEYKKASVYETLPEGNYTFDIKPEGQDKAIFNLPNVELKNGKNYTIIGLGLLKGDPAFDMIISQDN